MKNLSRFALVASLALCAGPVSAADVREGLVSYWPLDALTSDQSATPDPVTGNHLVLYGLDASGLVPGKRGKAVNFVADAQQYLSYTAPADTDTGLPISRAPSYSVLFWVKAAGQGQVDRRAFSESSSTDNDPLVNIGTHNAGTDGTVDLFIRTDAATTLINHAHSPGTAYDDQWHHVALVDANGQLSLYLDGALNFTTNYTRVASVFDTTAFGAIVRATPGSFFTGLIDDAALWERALSGDEIKDVMNNGIQLPVPAFKPTVAQEPAGPVDLIVGDALTLSARASGTRPFTYQWRKNGSAITGATTSTLSLSDLKQTDSGTYTVSVSNGAGQTIGAEAVLKVNPVAGPNLTNDMVAYWPLNEVQGGKTPDLVSGYDLELEGMTAADVKPGKWGNCLEFSNSRKTLLRRINNAGERLPIYQHPDFSVSLWVKGAANQSDRRVFSEGSTKSTQPLFNLGTHNGGTDGTVDSYIRTDSGSTSGDHKHSTGTAFDDTWHHIAYVQRTVAGAISAVLYVDGVKDDVVLGPVRPLTLNTTSVGGILRATPSAWFTGQIDDVALWSRALSQEEVQQLTSNGTPTPPPRLQPLALNSFIADLPAVVAGDTVNLRWDVSKDATEIRIEPGVGDVTTKTVAGAGSVSVTVAATTTYTITVRRGGTELTGTTSVRAVSGVAANWAMLDDFDRYALGPIADTGWWLDLRGNFARVEDRNGNHMLSVSSTDSAAVLRLKDLTVKEGQQRTLFFRMMPRGEPTAAVQHIVGLTDKNIRSSGDATSNIGPVVFPSFQDGIWQLGVINGVGGALEYAAAPLETNQIYDVWIDIKNAPKDDPNSPYDLFTVYLKKDGEASRTRIFQDYTSDRDPLSVDVILGEMGPDLDKLFVSGNNTTDTAWFDDFYLSRSGYNSSVPLALSVGGPPSLSIGVASGQITVTWDAGALESSPAVTGPWTAVSAAVSPYKVNPTGGTLFYRAKR